ncbi:MAG: trypsin-like serine protease [Polyangiales bacterium]
MSLVLGLWLSAACAREARLEARDESSAEEGDETPVVGDDDQVEDAGSVRPDARIGKLDAQVQDASADAAPDATAKPDAAATNDGGAPDGGTAMTTCPLKRYAFEAPATTAGDAFPVLEVNGGVTVEGAGCVQQWEGIVMTMGGRGLCTAAFISDRHLISASHCYARDGAVSLRVSAPTWEDGASHTFQAQVVRSGNDTALDVSIVDLGQAVPWATPERRFVLHAGMASAVDLHLYGFGSGGSSGAAGTLRGVPNRATLRVTDNGRGTLSGKAGEAQLCQGDSGGPAFVEKSAPVLYGINQAIVPTRSAGGRTCASADWTILFTNVSAYLPFVEKSVGKPCMRAQVDGLEVARCW